MLRVDVDGNTNRWSRQAKNEAKAIREVLAGNPWQSAKIYDSASRLIGRLEKRVDEKGRWWLGYYLEQSTVPVWERRI
jgi:hypothetical protein